MFIPFPVYTLKIHLYIEIVSLSWSPFAAILFVLAENQLVDAHTKSQKSQEITPSKSFYRII